MDPISITVVTDREATVDGFVDGSRLLVPVGDLAGATGWELKAQGLCRGDECVPVRDAGGLGADGLVDLVAMAAALRRPVAVEPTAGVIVMGRSATEVADALTSLEAPDFTLPTLDGTDEVSLHDLDGRKRLLVTFSSWCGCRYDLPAWADRHREWADKGFSVVAVALDEDPEAVRPFAEAAPGLPVLIDREHEVAERYGMVNVPTVVWIDEEGRIVRPNDAQFGDDQFVEFHHKPSGPHLDALRRWVEDGERPTSGDDEVRAGQMLPTDDEAHARVERRLAVHLERRGLDEAAEAHFATAVDLAPLDFPVRRGSMPMRGQDPFGTEFFEMYEEWEAVGLPYYAPRDRPGA